MNENTNKKLPCEIPFIIKFKYKKTVIAFVIFLIALGLSVFYISFIEKDYFISVIGLLIGLIFLYSYLKISIFKSYLEMTDTYIKVAGVTNNTVYWDDMVGFNLYSSNQNNFIGIITKQNVLRQQYFLSRLRDTLNYGPYTLVISLTLLPHIDVERLTLTIANKINNENVEIFFKREGLLESSPNKIRKNESKSSNFFIGFIYCFIVSTFIGISYGYLLKVFRGNLFLLIIIPVLGNLLIIYIYEKNYKEFSFNIYKRLSIGLISIFPIIIGLISKIYFEAKMMPNPNNLRVVVRNLSRSLLYDKIYFIVIALVTGYVFILGTLQGKKLKVQHKLKKILRQYKKYGDYYCAKEGSVFQIFLIDPEDFEDIYGDLLVVHINEGCLIEKNKIRLGGLYIPKEIILQLEIVVPDEQYVNIEGKQYYYINLGNPEKSKPQPYHLPCQLFLKENKEMCMIQINYFNDEL